jgi:hypothetical protein
MTAFGTASPAKPALRYRLPNSKITVSSSARKEDGDPNVEEIFRSGVWGLAGAPGFADVGDRILATLRCAGPLGADMVLHPLEASYL